MRRMNKRLFWAAGPAALCALPLIATAQDNVFRVPPAQVANVPAGRTQAVVQTVAPPGAGFITSTPYIPPFTPGYNPYNPWGQYLGPVGGALSGTADVINAQGQFAIQ